MPQVESIWSSVFFVDIKKFLKDTAEAKNQISTERMAVVAEDITEAIVMAEIYAENQKSDLWEYYEISSAVEQLTALVGFHEPEVKETVH